MAPRDPDTGAVHDGNPQSHILYKWGQLPLNTEKVSANPQQLPAAASSHPKIQEAWNTGLPLGLLRPTQVAFRD